MKSVLCPTCGCSLVRLQISREQAVRFSHDGADYYFCCDGCAQIFRSDPKRYLAQIRDVVVCPGCLGEKPLAVTVTVEHAGTTVSFCGCPHCEERSHGIPIVLSPVWGNGDASSLASPCP